MSLPDPDGWRPVVSSDVAAARPSGRRWVLAGIVGVVVAYVAGLLATLALDSNAGAFVGFIVGGVVAGYVVRARTIGRWVGSFAAVLIAGLLMFTVVTVLLLAFLAVDSTG
jgi:hypothetical protein